MFVPINERAHLSMKECCMNFDFLTSDFWRRVRRWQAWKAVRNVFIKSWGEGNSAEAAGGVCTGAERPRWEVTGKDDSRGGNGWPGRWRASSCGGSFNEAGSVFLPQAVLPCEISPLLCKAAWDAFQVTIAIVTCHVNSQGSGVHVHGCHCMLLL